MTGPWMRIAAAGLLAATALAQEASLSGPISGFLFDRPSNSIRPVRGVPGGAYLGPAVMESLEYASIAPNGKRALAWQGESLVLINDLSNAGHAIHIKDGSGEPAFAVWSSGSETAAIYYPKHNRIDILTDHITSVSVADLGRIASMSVDSGRRIVAVAESVGSAALFLIEEGGARSRLAELAGAAAAICPAGQSLHVVDARTLLTFDAAGLPSPASSRSLDVAEALDPAGMAVSRSGSMFYVADRASRSVMEFSFDSGALSNRLALDTTPSSLSRLGGGQTFFLNENRKREEAVLLFDLRSAPAVFFVPSGESR